MRTYGSRIRKAQTAPPTQSPDPPSSSTPTTMPNALKRPLGETMPNRPTKRTRTAQNTKKLKSTTELKQKALTQLHFCIDQSTLHKCPLCDLCYTKGAEEDVALHKAHCSRVQKGMEWSKEEDKEGYGTSITEVKNRVKLNNGRHGRIISFPADVGGKIGTKLSSLLQTVNLCLVSPPLSKPTLQSSKAYLFLLPQDSSSKSESIVGCVIAQRIEVAMEVLEENASDPSDGSWKSPDSAREVAGIFCKPQKLPTPMGISRMFVSSKHRRQGIARALLAAAADTFIPGCPLDPLKSQIAFSQPTGDGNKVMQNWGGGRIRIYEED
ncbi:hypothetical protein DFP72DRAFT_330864 [Ephemerocybe angulata]|uniref:N-acetyltransferase ECO1 n=1 Tax=Ephemerocybe angulata TaxID=980116 RepID=A0A8H6IIH4_9AGAR|nr:hypothetical protein DFP72DRAFT_330864 [Tulosesus angulatus]